MKNCKNCQIEKPLSEYYKHGMMAEGILNVCKDCVKARTTNRIKELKDNPDWVKLERYRCRIKSRKRTGPIDLEKKKEYMMGYKERYPEKIRAKILSQYIKCDPGHQKHHWSYQECDGKSVFFLTVMDHALIHRFLIYDKAAMKYRTIDGKLLDTKERHRAYLNHILKTQSF